MLKFFCFSVYLTVLFHLLGMELRKASKADTKCIPRTSEVNIRQSLCCLPSDLVGFFAAEGVSLSPIPLSFSSHSHKSESNIVTHCTNTSTQKLCQNTICALCILISCSISMFFDIFSLSPAYRYIRTCVIKHTVQKVPMRNMALVTSCTYYLTSTHGICCMLIAYHSLFFC